MGTPGGDAQSGNYFPLRGNRAQGTWEARTARSRLFGYLPTVPAANAKSSPPRGSGNGTLEATSGFDRLLPADPRLGGIHTGSICNTASGSIGWFRQQQGGATS